VVTIFSTTGTQRGTEVQTSFFSRRSMSFGEAAELRHLRGEELIMHLGLEYYD
jgi:hypothetical protein